MSGEIGLRVEICFDESKGLHVKLPRVRFTTVTFILSGIYLTTYLAYSVLVQLHKIPATKCPPFHTYNSLIGFPHLKFDLLLSPYLGT